MRAEVSAESAYGRAKVTAQVRAELRTEGTAEGLDTQTGAEA
jgi:hypothetical protein